MIQYPLLQINTNLIYDNAKLITDLCKDYGVNIAGVVKGFDGVISASKKMYDAGCKQIASSRMIHLKKIKNQYNEIPLMLLRIPMLSEVEDVIRYSDISLNSEKKVLIKLNEKAKELGKTHKVILMRDLGDLREGIIDKDEFIDLALFVENELSNIELMGIGTNLSCYGSIMPSEKNLNELSENAVEIEEKIGRKLEVVSGSGTTTLPLLLKNKVPKKINHLRIGEAIINTQDLPMFWDCNIKGLNKDTFILKAEIIEINEKPTYPIGEMCVNAFGECGSYTDKGIRKRAIPKDKGISVLGASSDHTIIDIHDSKNEYKVGDIVEFNVLYQAMLVSSSLEMVHKQII